jgi:hypothetical protein
MTAASVSDNANIIPTFVELTSAAVYADGADTTFLTIKAPPDELFEAPFVLAWTGHHTLEFEWLKQTGDPIDGATKFTVNL